MSDDPLVQMWQDHARPLNWRPWRALSVAEQATLRSLLINELWMCDHKTDAIAPWWWVRTHRELLELKMASGREPPPGPAEEGDERR